MLIIQSMSLVGRQIGSIRIDATLGEGGMGEVYRGTDVALARPVAVKVVRGERRMDDATKARFLREARLLSRLDHPNICRVYGLHEEPDGDVLILELVDGVPLAEAVKTRDLDGKLAIAEGIAAALSAAHEQRIVHRDLKPDNIMVTRNGVVKVLDFGVARSASAPFDTSMATVASQPEAPATDATVPSPEGALLTRRGLVVGTPAYMSPEQASGERVDEASDVYSFGLLLRELVTGEPAFEPSTEVMELLARAARGETRPLGEIDPDVRSLILEMTQREPDSRPTASRTLERIRWIRGRAARRRRRLLWGAGTVALAGLMVGAALVTFRLARPRPVLAPGQKGRVVLLPFFDASGEKRNGWVELGLRHLAAETLDGAGGVEVVSGDVTRKAVDAVGLDLRTEPARAPLAALASSLKAELVVATRVERSGEAWVFRTTTQDARGSRGSRSFEAADPAEGANLLAARLAERLTGSPLAPDAKDRFSESPFLNRLYAMGVDRNATTGPPSARPYFQVCLDADPSFQRARLAMAECDEKLGEWDRSREAAATVLAEAEKGRDEALQAAALDVLGNLASLKGDYGTARSLLDRSVEVQKRAGARQGLARTFQALGIAERRSDRLAESRRFHELALALRRESGDRWGEARSLMNLGALAEETKDLDSAQRLLGQALKVQEELRDRAGQAQTLNSLGILTARRGDLAESSRRFTASLDLKRALGDREGAARTLSNLGDLAFQQGRFAESERSLRESIQISHEIGATPGEALASYNLAQLLVVWSRPEDAGAPLAVAREFYGRDRTSSDWVDVLLLDARLAYALGELAPAVAKADEARRVAGESWSGDQEAYLESYRRSLAAGRRLSLPPEPRNRGG